MIIVFVKKIIYINYINCNNKLFNVMNDNYYDY